MCKIIAKSKRVYRLIFCPKVGQHRQNKRRWHYFSLASSCLDNFFTSKSTCSLRVLSLTIRDYCIDYCMLIIMTKAGFVRFVGHFQKGRCKTSTLKQGVWSLHQILCMSRHSDHYVLYGNPLIFAKKTPGLKVRERSQLFSIVSIVKQWPFSWI